MDDNEIHITTQQQALKWVRELAAPYKPKNDQASDQLIEARRQDATQENSELSDTPHG